MSAASAAESPSQTLRLFPNTTCLSLTRNFALGDVAEMSMQGTQRTLSEDHTMLEAQEHALADAALEGHRLHTASDGAPSAGRKLVATLLRQEQA